MTEDWVLDVRTYAPQANAKASAGIGHLGGIAFQNKNSSLIFPSTQADVAGARGLPEEEFTDWPTDRFAKRSAFG